MTVSISNEEEFLQLAKDKEWKIDEKVEAKIENLPEKRKVIKLTCQAT